MIMDLPMRYSLKSFAHVRNGNLLIFRLTKFESQMFSITYCLKRRICIYCGKVMGRNNCTLDHRYPVDMGGISIPNNLFPCCSDCNSSKNSMSHQDYLLYRNLPDYSKKAFIQQVYEKNEEIRKTTGFILPKDWVTFTHLNRIIYHRQVVELRGPKYIKISECYSKYGTFLRPAVVDCSNHLLDGYNVIFFARENKIENIPIVQLENVSYLMKNDGHKIDGS